MDHHTQLRSRVFVLAYILVFAASGCAGPRQTAPKVDPATLDDDAFQSYLAQAGMVTVDEAYRAMVILADGKDGSKDFEERRKKLESRGIANPLWNLKPQNVIDSGAIAFMICRICKISGGVDMVVLGSWGLGDRRYAMRELIYREMIEDSVDYQYMTGAKLVGLMSKADTIMAKKNLYNNQGIQLTDEKDRDAQGNLIVPKSKSEK